MHNYCSKHQRRVMSLTFQVSASLAPRYQHLGQLRSPLQRLLQVHMGMVLPIHRSLQVLLLLLEELEHQTLQEVISSLTDRSQSQMHAKLETKI